MSLHAYIGNQSLCRPLRRWAFVLVVMLGLLNSTCSADEPASVGNESIRTLDQNSVNLKRQRALVIFDSATVVETYRLRPPSMPPRSRSRPDGPAALFDQHWPIYGRGPDQGPAFARQLRDFLVDERNFTPRNSAIKACAFEPTVGFGVRSPHGGIDITVCFGCGDLVVSESAGDLQLDNSDFLPGYRKLLEYALIVFPADEYLIRRRNGLSRSGA